MACLLGSTPFLKPKPHSLTSGATVMSNAPSVSRDIFSARLNTSVNFLLRLVFWLLFIAVMMLCLLNGDNAESTSFISASISGCKSLA